MFAIVGKKELQKTSHGYGFLSIALSPIGVLVDHFGFSLAFALNALIAFAGSILVMFIKQDKKNLI